MKAQIRTLASVTALLFVAIAAVPARADYALASYFWNWNDAPVRITGCAAGVVDSQYNSNYYIGANVTMRNTDPTRTATIVRFRFQLYDAFKSLLDEYTMDAEGRYSPDVLIELKPKAIAGLLVPSMSGHPYFETINIWPSARLMQISVEKVLFSDGTTYVNPNVPPVPGT